MLSVLTGLPGGFHKKTGCNEVQNCKKCELIKVDFKHGFPFLLPSVKYWLAYAVIFSGITVFLLSEALCSVTYGFVNCIAVGFPSHFLKCASLRC